MAANFTTNHFTVVSQISILSKLNTVRIPTNISMHTAYVLYSYKWTS